MINFLIQHPETGRYLFGVVITERNIELLKQGKPIHLNTEQIQMPAIQFQEFFIMYYETEEEAIVDLKKKGYLTKETVVEIVKQGKVM